VVFFPQLMTPIFVGRDKTRRAIEDTMTKDGRLFIATQKRASEDDPDCASLYAVGVTADIIHRMARPDGTMKVRVCCSESPPSSARSIATIWRPKWRLSRKLVPWTARHSR
jgi:ATP-dependent Lon protease